jgi:hypothetical protein
MDLNIDELISRYAAAQGRMDMWMVALQTVYQLVIPNQAKFSMKERMPGQAYNLHVYDWTAPSALTEFGNNIVNNLMPSGTNWAKFTPGRKLKKQEETPEVRELLQYFEDTLFDFLNSSNFYRVVQQSIMEMAISTGVLLINEGASKDQPFTFTSVPLHECAFGGQPGGEIYDVYRKYKVEGRYLQHNWPRAVICEQTMQEISQDPSSEVGIIEGTVFKPEMPKDKQYCYFVMIEDRKEMIVTEYRSYSPWVVFRPHVFSGELLGRGPMLNMETALLTINRLAEDELRLNKFLSKPIFLSESGSGVNPYTAVVEPGVILPVENTSSFKQLPIEGNLQDTQLKRQEVKQDILHALGVNQFQPETETAKTATEVSIVNDNRKLQNNALAGRLQYELAHQIIDKCFRILSRFGYWKSPIIDEQHIKIEFKSPINEAQNKINIDKIVEYAQYVDQIMGPQLGPTALAYGANVEQIPTFIAKQLALDPELIRDALSKSKMLQGMQQAATQQQEPQAGPMQNQQQPGGTDGQQPQLSGLNGAALQQGA